VRIKDKIAIVTGSGGGLGMATAVRLAEEGAKVIINDINEGTANQTAQKIKEIGGEVTVVIANVIKRREAEKLIEAAVTKFGRLDILVNMVGGPRDALFKDLKEENWDYVIELNLKGGVNCTQFATKYMTDQKYGKIVNIASRAYLGNIGQACYSTAKAGVVGLTRALSLELASYNINVNCVTPGLIDTPQLRKFLPEKFIQKRIEITPLKRLGQPVDIANAILFLVSDESSFITGQNIIVGGGSQPPSI